MMKDGKIDYNYLWYDEYKEGEIIVDWATSPGIEGVVIDRY